MCGGEYLSLFGVNTTDVYQACVSILTEGFQRVKKTAWNRISSLVWILYLGVLDYKADDRIRLHIERKVNYAQKAHTIED